MSIIETSLYKIIDDKLAVMARDHSAAQERPSVEQVGAMIEKIKDCTAVVRNLRKGETQDAYAQILSNYTMLASKMIEKIEAAA